MIEFFVLSSDGQFGGGEEVVYSTLLWKAEERLYGRIREELTEERIGRELGSLDYKKAQGWHTPQKLRKRPFLGISFFGNLGLLVVPPKDGCDLLGTIRPRQGGSTKCTAKIGRPRLTGRGDPVVNRLVRLFHACNSQDCSE